MVRSGPKLVSEAAKGYLREHGMSPRDAGSIATAERAHAAAGSGRHMPHDVALDGESDDGGASVMWQ
jgi:hypothetical protein